MADKKLNEVTAASDGAYVYAEDASGNQIKISKADLASVVAGQMTTERLFPFMGGVYASSLNTVKDGWSVVNATTTNRPASSDTGTIGLCLTISANQRIYIAQICWLFSDGVHVRSTYNGESGAWGAWKRIDNV